jgi:IS5 family transposase
MVTAPPPVRRRRSTAKRQGPRTSQTRGSNTNGEVYETDKAKNRIKSGVRARVEHVFGVVMRLWGFGKVRYRGLQKNATRAFTAVALANIFLARKTLIAQVRP